MGFVRFDFSEYEDIIGQLQRVTLSVDTYTDAKVENGSNFVVYVLPDSMEDGLDPATLSYSEAEKRGLTSYTDNLVYVSQSGLKPSTTYKTDDFYTKVKENLDANPDNRVVWLKIASTEGVGFTLYGNASSNSNAIRPRLSLGYPKIPIELDTIDLKIPQKLNRDFSLPNEGAYGSEITWSSSDESVISSGGKVNSGIAGEDYSKNDPVVKLTATVRNGGDTKVKTFDVRAVRKGVLDASHDTYINSEANLADDTSLIFGGTSGNLAFIGFDIASDAEYMQKSRKTVLKVYATDENAGGNIEVSCITDSALKNSGIDEITYSEAESIAASKTEFTAKAEINSDGYALFDVTEYIMSLKDTKALFSLKTDGPRISLYSTEGSAFYPPMLIASPTEYTDEYALETALQNLTFNDISKDSADSVRTDFILPSTAVFGGTITWTSSDTAINASNGKITRGSQNRNVTLSATVSVGKATGKKTFDVVVVKKETDYEYALALAETLELGYSLLTSGITLPGENIAKGAAVTWSSNHEEARIDGYNLIIKRPADEDMTVTLKATVTYNGVSASKDYYVILMRAAGKNIFRNRKIISGDLSASNAIDENIDTVWHIENRETVYDMGTNRVISGMTVVPSKCSFSGITVYASKDNYVWENVYSGGSFKADVPNYINMQTEVYARYIKVEFPPAATDISFLAAYSSNDFSEQDIFAAVKVPERASASFVLTGNVDGNEIKWQSSSPIIQINGKTASVTQGSVGTNVTLTACVTAAGTKYEKSYVVYVPASASSNSGGGGGGGGGGSSGSAGGSHHIAVPVNTAPQQTEDKKPEQTPSSTPTQEIGQLADKFTDISAYPWAREAINILAEKDIISGRGDGKFFPQDNIKREEMAKILVSAFDIETASANEEFADVASGSWYEEYVLALTSSGCASGIGERMFGVGQSITRQDAFKMIVSVLKIDALKYPAAEFNDYGEISDYALEAVNALYAIGIINGDDNGNINPKSYITRAEAANVISLAMEYLN